MRAAFSASAQVVFLASQSAVGKAQDPFRPPSRLSHHFDRHHHDPRYSLGCHSLHDVLKTQYSSLEVLIVTIADSLSCTIWILE